MQHEKSASKKGARGAAQQPKSRNTQAHGRRDT